MTDEQAVFRPVLVNPADDTARLVYADYCDDHPGPDGAGADRALFVRGQVELAAYAKAYPDLGRVLVSGNTLPVRGAVRNDEWARMIETAHAVREVFARRREAWSPRTPSAVPEGPRLLGLVGPCARWAADQCGGVAVFDRGFVAAVKATPIAFGAAAAEWFSAHPLVRVDLLRAPRPLFGVLGGDKWGHTWYYFQKSRLLSDGVPPAVVAATERAAELTTGFDKGDLLFRTKAKARAALSAACVAVGREAAGLPPLPWRR